ncbi:MAG: magnesium transporter, partial [Cyclobacteriaceae bacterium]|nr:magnesium transporter [Cyclobacteriaceae bacterium HetDA_MAG_MS6]
MEFELSKEYLERFQLALDTRDDHFIQGSLDGINPADISALLDEFDTEESKYVFDLLPPDVDAAILNDLDEDVRIIFIESFTSEELARFIECLDSDDGADILMEMGLKRREDVIGHIQSEEKAA